MTEWVIPRVHGGERKRFGCCWKLPAGSPASFLGLDNMLNPGVDSHHRQRLQKAEQAGLLTGVCRLRSPCPRCGELSSGHQETWQPEGPAQPPLLGGSGLVLADAALLGVGLGSSEAKPRSCPSALILQAAWPRATCPLVRCNSPHLLVPAAIW